MYSWAGGTRQPCSLARRMAGRCAADGLILIGDPVAPGAWWLTMRRAFLETREGCDGGGVCIGDGVLVWEARGV